VGKGGETGSGRDLDTGNNRTKTETETDIAYFQNPQQFLSHEVVGTLEVRRGDMPRNHFVPNRLGQWSGNRVACIPTCDNDHWYGPLASSSAATPFAVPSRVRIVSSACVVGRGVVAQAMLVDDFAFRAFKCTAIVLRDEERLQPKYNHTPNPRNNNK
jgi:hypothetical protein